MPAWPNRFETHGDIGVDGTPPQIADFPANGVAGFGCGERLYQKQLHWFSVHPSVREPGLSSLIQINAGGGPLWQGLAVSREVGTSSHAHPAGSNVTDKQPNSPRLGGTFSSGANQGCTQHPGFRYGSHGFTSARSIYLHPTTGRKVLISVSSVPVPTFKGGYGHEQK